MKMENLKRVIDSFDLLEIQELIGTYLDHLQSYSEKDSFMEECRSLQCKRCELILTKIEEVFEDEYPNL